MLQTYFSFSVQYKADPKQNMIFSVHCSGLKSYWARYYWDGWYHATYSFKSTFEKVKELFEDQKMWLKAELLHKSQVPGKYLKLVLPVVAYYFSSGPWRNQWIKVRFCQKILTYVFVITPNRRTFFFPETENLNFGNWKLLRTWRSLKVWKLRGL